MGEDPAVWLGHKLKVFKDGKGSYMPWSVAQYHQLLAIAEDQGKQGLYAAIVIGAHTGCSVQGIANSSLVEVDGITCIHLPETKTSGRTPTIPAQDEVRRVYPLWERYRLSNLDLSKWFTRTKQKLTDDRQLRFHSFRVSVATMLEQNGVSEILAARMLGHKINASLPYGLYSKGPSPRELVEAIKALDWSLK